MTVAQREAVRKHQLEQGVIGGTRVWQTHRERVVAEGSKSPHDKGVSLWKERHWKLVRTSDVYNRESWEVELGSPLINTWYKSVPFLTQCKYIKNSHNIPKKIFFKINKEVSWETQRDLKYPREPCAKAVDLLLWLETKHARYRVQIHNKYL